MKFAIYNTATGQISKTFECYSADEALLQCTVSDACFDVSDQPNITDATHYVDIALSAVQPFPAKPSKYHVWNWSAAAWDVSASGLASAKADVKASIENKRLALESAPISYTGKNLDANPEAIRNINGKLQELAARIALNQPIPADQMFWRDADNVLHNWGVSAVYQEWLQGLAIAIVSRSTALYSACWAKKADVDALTDMSAVLAYDVNSGW